MIKPDLSSLCTSVMRDSSALSINHVSWITLSNQAGNWPIRCPLMARLLLNRPETTRRKTERRDLIHSSADAEQKARDKLLARPGEQSHSSVYRIQPLPLSLCFFTVYETSHCPRPPKHKQAVCVQVKTGEFRNRGEMKCTHWSWPSFCGTNSTID